MSVVNPIGLFTNHLTFCPPVVKVVECPESGIGHSGRPKGSTGVTEKTGPFVGPISIVLVTQSFSSAPNSHVTGLTSKSKVPYQPTFQVNIPLFGSIIPGELTEEPAPGKTSSILHSKEPKSFGKSPLSLAVKNWTGSSVA